jgi:tRNA(fMet)-specific endonuclease VapC
VGGRAARAARVPRQRDGPLARLILDTTVLVAAERGSAAPLDLVGDDDDVAIAAVTAAELLVGVEMADAKRRAGRERFVSEILDTLSIEPYDLAIARSHAKLLAHTRRQGQQRGAHDLLIAATARATDRIVVTADGGGFTDLPGVEIRLPAG